MGTKQLSIECVNNGGDAINCYAEFENFLRSGTMLLSFMTINAKNGSYTREPPPPLPSRHIRYTPFILGLHFKWVNNQMTI